MKINKHGLKMKNLKAVSGATVNNSWGYSQISYDMATGELLEAWHVGNCMTSWTEYHDPDVINVCNTSRHMAMQEIADAVRDAVHFFKRVEADLREATA